MSEENAGQSEEWELMDADYDPEFERQEDERLIQEMVATATVLFNSGLLKRTELDRIIAVSKLAPGESLPPGPEAVRVPHIAQPIKPLRVSVDEDLRTLNPGAGISRNWHVHIAGHHIGTLTMGAKNGYFVSPWYDSGISMSPSDEEVDAWYESAMLSTVCLLGAPSTGARL